MHYPDQNVLLGGPHRPITGWMEPQTTAWIKSIRYLRSGQKLPRFHTHLDTVFIFFPQTLRPGSQPRTVAGSQRIFTRDCCQFLVGAVSRTITGLHRSWLPVSWRCGVRPFHLAMKGVSTSPCRRLIHGLTLNLRPRPLRILGCGPPAALVRLSSYGCRPFSDLETLGQVSRQKRPFDRLLPKPDCGSQSASPFFLIAPYEASSRRLRLERFRTSHARVDGTLLPPKNSARKNTRFFAEYL